MRIDIYSLQKSHSFALSARFSTKNIRNVSCRVISSLDDIAVSSAEYVDNVGLLCVGTNLHDILDDIKKTRISIPIIAMCDQSDINNDISLLDEGYDDVVRMNCGINEIVARFRSIARRMLSSRSNEVRHGRLVTFLDGQDPEIDGTRVKLTHIEHTILDAISRRSGTIISREKLYELIYSDGDKQPFDKVLDVHIYNLRSKLKKASGGNAFIETLPQRGYRLRID